MTSQNAPSSILTRTPAPDPGCPILRIWTQLARWALGGIVIGTLGITLSAGCGLDVGGACLSCEGMSTELETPPNPSADTAAGRRLKEWLAAYNSGDERRVTDFIATRYAPSALAGRTPRELAQRELLSHDQTGGYSVIRIEEATAHRLTARLQQWNNEGFARLTLRVDPADPERITDLGRSPIQAQ
jgi:hypothetical protein